MQKLRQYPTLTLVAVKESFPLLQEWLSGIADELHPSPGERKQLLISADEIFTNIANYAYGEDIGTVSVSASFDIGSRCLQLTFCDNGKAFDPLASREPDIKSKLSERQIGGLGIFMVRKMMDAVEYKREDNSNILVLEKKLTGDGK